MQRDDWSGSRERQQDSNLKSRFVSASIDFAFENFNKLEILQTIKTLTKKTKEEITLTFNFLTDNVYY